MKDKKEPLVSIISPCYDEEKYISAFLDSVLNQIYGNIELIMIDDGSTDATRLIIESYKNKFFKRGYSFVYIYQNNAGQAAALNRGLKIFRGKYLMWVDADDILLPENVLKKVQFLEEHKNCGMVCVEGEMVDGENNNRRIGDYKRKKPINNDNLFEDLLLEKNVVFAPGVYMITREAFEKSVPGRKIYESREGQNWQLLLPVSYSYPCGYIEECLFKYVIHDDSHSRMERTDAEWLDRIENMAILLENVINGIYMIDSEKRKYLEMITVKYAKQAICLIAKSNTICIKEHEKLMRDKIKILFKLNGVQMKYIMYFLWFKVRIALLFMRSF